MQLNYRGVNYEAEPSFIEYDEGAIAGKYRGQYWNFQYPRHIPHLKPKGVLQYRGIAYSTFPIAKTVADKQSCTVPVQKPVKLVANEIAQIHLENIRRNLERRLAAAIAKGDDQLINLLENESRQLALSF